MIMQSGNRNYHKTMSDENWDTPIRYKAVREECRVTLNRLRAERKESRVTPDCLKTGCRIMLNRRKVVLYVRDVESHLTSWKQ